MKKILIVLSVLSMFVAAECLAQTVEGWPPRGQKEKPKMLKVGETPSAPASDFTFSLTNLSGDIGIIYGSSGSVIAPGIGVDLITYKQGLLTLRGEAFASSQYVLNQPNQTIGGAAIMVNLAQAAGFIPGASWVAHAINPSVGIFGGYDFQSGSLCGGPMISLINIPF